MAEVQRLHSDAEAVKAATRAELARERAVADSMKQDMHRHSSQVEIDRQSVQAGGTRGTNAGALAEEAAVCGWHC